VEVPAPCDRGRMITAPRWLRGSLLNSATEAFFWPSARANGVSTAASITVASHARMKIGVLGPRGKGSPTARTPRLASQPAHQS